MATSGTATLRLFASNLFETFEDVQAAAKALEIETNAEGLTIVNWKRLQ